MKTDPRLPYTELSDDFLPPRDPVLGYIKVGSKDSAVRYTRAGKPWVAPTRFVDPARFEVTTREKETKTVKGAKGSNVASQDFTVDLGYVRDDAFHKLEDVGQAPSSLRIRLLYPKWNQNLISFLGAYGGGEWVCRGNGVEATDIKRGKCACPCPRLIQFSGKYDGPKMNDGVSYKDGNTWKKDGLFPCKPHAQLNVMLYDAGIFGGFWPFKTTSYETTSNLIKTLRMFQEMFKRVDGLPLELRVMPATKQIPGGGTTVQPIVTLVLAASGDTARQIAASAAAESRKFLPAGRELDHETYLEAVVSEMETEAESYAGEFLPEGEVLEAEEVEEPAPHDPALPGELESREEFRRDMDAAEQERGDGPEGSGGRHPSPPDDPTQEDGDDVEDKPHGGFRDGEAGDGEQGEALPHGRDDDNAGSLPEGGRADASGRDGDVADRGPDRAENPGGVDDSDRNDPKDLEEYDRDDYLRATLVLEATGNWTPDSIYDRLEYHRKQGTLDKLLDRLERGYPEAWAKVAQSAEPEDGLEE